MLGRVKVIASCVPVDEASTQGIGLTRRTVEGCRGKKGAARCSGGGGIFGEWRQGQRLTCTHRPPRAETRTCLRLWGAVRRGLAEPRRAPSRVLGRRRSRVLVPVCHRCVCCRESAGPVCRSSFTRVGLRVVGTASALAEFIIKLPLQTPSQRERCEVQMGRAESVATALRTVFEVNKLYSLHVSWGLEPSGDRLSRAQIGPAMERLDLRLIVSAEGPVPREPPVCLISSFLRWKLVLPTPGTPTRRA